MSKGQKLIQRKPSPLTLSMTGSKFRALCTCMMSFLWVSLGWVMYKGSLFKGCRIFFCYSWKKKKVLDILEITIFMSCLII